MKKFLLATVGLVALVRVWRIFRKTVEGPVPDPERLRTAI
jgi:hypothetical protein